MSTFKWDEERCSDETAKIDGQNLIDNNNNINLCVTEKVEQISETIQNHNDQNTVGSQKDVIPSADQTNVSADRLAAIETNIQKLITDNKELSESFKKRMNKANKVEEKLDSLIETMRQFAK